MFLLLSVLLAVIVEFWLTYLKKTNDTEKLKERQGITKAFTWIDYEKRYCIDQKSWNQLILILKKDFTEIQSQFMFDMLDLEEKGSLDILDFLNITEALNLQYDLKNVNTSIENTKAGVIARRIIGLKLTITCWGFLTPTTMTLKTAGVWVLVVHTVLALCCTLTISPQLELTIRILNTFLLTLMVLEQILRLVAKGRGFFQSLTNRWDFVIVTISSLAMVAYWVSWALQPPQKAENCVVRDICKITWEILIIIRPGISGNILVFFYKVINVLSELFLFIVVIVYVYMVIGLELFAVASNKPEDNYFEEYGCGLGFKRPACAFFTLIQQITSSNWHEMMNSVTAATGVWAYFYFCIFYITINLVLLDLTIAMTIEMYNTIKFQYFNKNRREDSEGVIFEVGDGASDKTPTQDTSRKKSLSMGWTQIQVTQCTSGSWRKSVLSTEKEAGKVSNEDLDKIQKFLEKTEIEHGSLRGKPYLGAKDRDIVNVKQLLEDKLSDSKNRNNPECVLYFWYPLLDWDGKEVGEVLLELKDHHTHDACIKLNFNSENRPVSGRVMSGGDVYTDNITFLSRDEMEAPQWDYCGFLSTNWTVKKSQRTQLKKDKVRMEVLLCDSTQRAKKKILTATFTGYEESRTKWEENQREVKTIRKSLGNISYLMERNAYRVTRSKQDSTSECEVADVEGYSLSSKDDRIIYKIKKSVSEEIVSKAERAWNLSMNLGRSTWGKRSCARRFRPGLRAILLSGAGDCAQLPEESDSTSSGGELTEDSERDERKHKKVKRRITLGENTESVRKFIKTGMSNLKIKNANLRMLSPSSLKIPKRKSVSLTPPSTKSCKDFRSLTKSDRSDDDKPAKAMSLPTTPTSKSRFFEALNRSRSSKNSHSSDTIPGKLTPKSSQFDRRARFRKQCSDINEELKKKDFLSLPKFTLSVTGPDDTDQLSDRSSVVFTLGASDVNMSDDAGV